MSSSVQHGRAAPPDPHRPTARAPHGPRDNARTSARSGTRHATRARGRPTYTVSHFHVVVSCDSRGRRPRVTKLGRREGAGAGNSPVSASRASTVGRVKLAHGLLWPWPNSTQEGDCARAAHHGFGHIRRVGPASGLRGSSQSACIQSLVWIH